MLSYKLKVYFLIVKVKFIFKLKMYNQCETQK